TVKTSQFGPSEDVRVEAGGLSCGWPGRAPAVADVSLSLEPGRSVAIVGPSGVGKTTLLMTLAGLLPPRGGTLEVDGVARAADDRERVEQALFVAEDAHVFSTSVLENLRVARGDLNREE